jgi:hypothetical protein
MSVSFYDKSYSLDAFGNGAKPPHLAVSDESTSLHKLEDLINTFHTFTHLQLSMIALLLASGVTRNTFATPRNRILSPEAAKVQRRKPPPLYIDRVYDSLRAVPIPGEGCTSAFKPCCNNYKYTSV